MLDDSSRPEIKRDASPAGAIGGIVVGAVSGALVWALIALIISRLF